MTEAERLMGLSDNDLAREAANFQIGSPGRPPYDWEMQRRLLLAQRAAARWAKWSAIATAAAAVVAALGVIVAGSGLRAEQSQFLRDLDTRARPVVPPPAAQPPQRTPPAA